ncbi:MAG: hypothetical protein PHS53_02250 [Candidatus Pacebacteria bacterium]|nr:hypothetical protein [Candidatus Paceibacterota bacterium]MDD5356947.1 hypothetical protein [Candidatus Paceibacterota bacterium]
MLDNWIAVLFVVMAVVLCLVVLYITILAVKNPKLTLKATLRFREYADLGVLQVPADYNHRTYLASCVQRNGDEWDFDSGATDANFPTPSRILRPGDRLRVRIWEQIGGTNSHTRMEFLDSLGAVYPGVQGICLLCEEMEPKLPHHHSNLWFGSYDRPENLFQDERGNQMFMRALVVKDPDSIFLCLCSFGSPSDDNEMGLIVCFTEAG